MLVLSCNAPRAPAPVVERSAVAAAPAALAASPATAADAPATYTVRKNDTLYSIAWRHNLEYKTLAAANDIAPPYTVFPGQRILLRAAASARPVPAAPAPAQPPERSTPAPAPRPTTPPPAKPAPAPPRPPSPAATSPSAAGGWRQPVAAQPERRFGGGSKGFDYTLAAQTRIHAAAAGEVVYAGPGLGGYRHLVIVKVSERYLVAYGVNVAPALSEGDKVAVGGTVATISGGGPAAGRFHFEIRDRGKPIDPRRLIGSG